MHQVSAQTSGLVAWSPATTISESGLSVPTDSPHISMSADGTKAIAVWSIQLDSHFIIQSAVATISGGSANWGDVTNLTASGANADLPKVAISSDGSAAVAIWRRGHIQTRTATIFGDEATWGSVTDLTSGALTVLKRL